MDEKEITALLKKNPKLINQNSDMKQYIHNPQNRSKHLNVKVYVYANGYISYGINLEKSGKPQMIFDSIKEYSRFQELKILERANKIKNLERQKKIVIQEKGEYRQKTIKEIYYKADFVYVRNGVQVVEDVKPFDKKTGKYRTTQDFRLKWKMMKLKFPDISFEIY